MVPQPATPSRVARQRQARGAPLARLAGLILVVLPARRFHSPPAGATWTGSLQRPGGVATQVRFHIPTRPSGGRGLWIQFPDRGTVHDVALGMVAFSGITVSFRTAAPLDAGCHLEAAPAGGYDGLCVSAAGDSIALTMVPPVAGMLLPDHEVALARDAGPPEVVPAATIFVLGAGGYFEAFRGTNGFVCYVWRPTPTNDWPICQSRDAARALFPVESLRVALRIKGVDEAGIADSIASGYRSGRFRPPADGAIGYMLSASSWSVDSGTRIFIPPHLHFYTPYGTAAQLGIDTTDHWVVPIRMERSGEPDATVVVGVRLRKPG